MSGPYPRSATPPGGSGGTAAGGGGAAGSARLAGAKDLDAVAGILAAAFQEEPVTAWIFPRPHRRRALLPRFFHAVAEDLLAYAEIHLRDDVGAVLVVPPYARQPDATRRRHYEQRLRAATAECADRALFVAWLLERHHPAAPAHYYVAFTGVRPERQSRGICSAIMRSLLARADDDGVGTYIECSTVRSMALMARHGFTARPAVALPDGPVLFPAWRQPASRTASGPLLGTHVDVTTGAKP